MSHRGCPICQEIMSALSQPTWFCRLCRRIKSEPRAVRRHLTRLVEDGTVQTKILGGMVFYKAKKKA